MSVALTSSEQSVRILVWAGTGLIVGLDAAINTPLGLSSLLVVPLSGAALRLPRWEVVTLACICILDRLLFGPVGDPLGLGDSTLTVSATTQLWASAALTIALYLGVIWTFTRLSAQTRHISALKTETERDALTGAANRRAMQTFLAKHAGEPGAAIAIDADHFKRVNDTYGHAAGDQVLMSLSRLFAEATRGGDLVARVGGEEFLLLLVGAGPQVAEQVTERILWRVRALAIDVGSEHPLSVTVSAGGAAGPFSPALVEEADAALYDAKHSGRDRLVMRCAPEDPNSVSVAP